MIDKKKKIGIIIDEDFAIKNAPPYPFPTFYSYETPLRIRVILDYLEKKGIFKNENIVKINPIKVEEDIIQLAHTQYHVNSIKALSNRGSGLLGDEVFITKDTFELAKKAVGATITAINDVINGEVSQSFALIRPPGHHALREKSSGLCIFNNIANSILFLREEMKYSKRITVIDIDAHFGDGIVQYFYDDPNVMYFSIHEYDYVEGEIGFIDELGAGEGLGKSINFPIPLNSTDNDFLATLELLELILREFRPDLIIIAAGFDMYYEDPIGNCLLTSYSYYKFTEKLLKISEDICEGRLVFVLEGGYSLIGLPVCVQSVLKSLLRESYERPSFEYSNFSDYSKKIEIEKINSGLKRLLAEYWSSIR
jgi:acetoin utilization deacetylase AcuC-like enzyme